MSYRTVLDPKDRIRVRSTVDVSEREMEIIQEVMREKGIPCRADFFKAAIEAYAGRKIFRERLKGRPPKQ